MSEPGLGHLAAYWFFFAAQAFFAAEPFWDNFLVAATLVPDFLTVIFLTVIFVGLFFDRCFNRSPLYCSLLNSCRCFFCRRCSTAGSTVLLGLTFRVAGFFGTRTFTTSCSPDRSMLHFASSSMNQKWVMRVHRHNMQTKPILVAKATPGSARRSIRTSTVQGMPKINHISVLLANYPHTLL
jgi:hypothetical protein